ncbi:hypothetical protein [Actinocorallia longicatena]
MPGSDLPIMCTLTPNKMVDRLMDFEALFAEHLTILEREPLLLRLTFAVDDSQEEKVRELFAAEQQCCAFLTFTYDRTGDGLVVSIAAPEEAAPTLDGFQTLAERNTPPAVVADGWTG